MTEHKIFGGDSVRFQGGGNDVCTLDWWRGCSASPTDVRENTTYSRYVHI